MSNIPCIALVGNAPAEKRDMLNSLLDEEELTEMYDVALYGAAGQPEISALNDAIRDYEDGAADGIVCLPTAIPLRDALQEVTGGGATPIYISTTGRLTPVRHETTAEEAGRALTQEDITKAAKALWRTLKRDLGIQNPRIAITSLNDKISTEETSAEMTVIAPAVSELVNSGIQAFGPVASSKLFEGNDFMAFDAVLQMYDGQLNDVFREIAPDGSVTLFTGTEVPVTQAEPDQLLHAITLAGDVMRNRKEYDLPFSNPLQKLYREKKEDGDKARFAVKKKGFNPAEHRRENVTYVKEENKSNS